MKNKRQWWPSFLVFVLTAVLMGSGMPPVNEVSAEGTESSLSSTGDHGNVNLPSDEGEAVKAEEDGPDEPLSTGTEEEVSAQDDGTMQAKTADIGAFGLFAGGDGSLEQPYLIETAEQLNAVRNNLEAHYQLVQDIDLSGYATIEGWEPIGTDSARFSGTFDGQGHHITGLGIGARYWSLLGLFGIVGDSGIIKNVILEDVRVGVGSYYHWSSGGVAGINYGTIREVHVTGSVDGSHYSGGLAGMNYGIINGSSFSGTVAGLVGVGGLAGENGGDMSSSYASAQVSGDDNVGTLAGRNSGRIHSSYAKGTVNTRQISGGLVGINLDSGMIIGTYFSGTISGAGDGIGGLVGINNGSVDSSYWNTSAYNTAPPDNGIGTPVTEEELKQHAIYDQWDFEDTWYLYNGQTLPFLQWEDPFERAVVAMASETLDVGNSTQMVVTANHQRQSSYIATNIAGYAVSEGESIVDVDQEGQITAKAPGRAVISVTLHGDTTQVEVIVNPYTVTGVIQPDALTVANGTPVDEIGLPDTVQVTLSPGQLTRAAAVEWTLADENHSYQPATPGIYTFTGSLVNLPEDVANPDRLKATINVTVGQPFIVKMSDIPTIQVSHGTQKSAITLPKQVEAGLNHGGTAKMNVTWDHGEPVYNGRQAGTYTFKGSLELPDGIINPNELHAVAQVTVLEKSRDGGSGGSNGSVVSGGNEDLLGNTCVKGTEGRTILFPKGKIIIPKSVGNVTFCLNFKVIEDTSAFPLTESERLVSQVIEITKNWNGAFHKAVTLNLEFGTDALNNEEDTVSLYWLNEKTNEWVELKNIKVDWDQGTVAGTIDHLAQFAVIATKVKKEVEGTPETSFTDLDGHWAKDMINQWARIGVISGYLDGTFKPDRPITRAEFVSLLVRAFNLDERSGHAFSDTKGHWAQDRIATAQAHGIIEGYTPTYFAGKDPITREQMAVMVMRWTGLSAGEGTPAFIDQDSISSWAWEAAVALSEQGVLTGYPGGSFLPQNEVTRAEAVVLLLRAMEMKRPAQGGSVMILR
ncbi:S-layer homology domain-containing protein [Paenibacillus sp. NPDC093718]|uniref:S-layer homology domain-containing protein n=1 Tax=Paenibacillus sp. NPDC093718 TaxID=3390601 RepID=UPI003D0929DD